MSDRDGREVSVYALNYGLCQQEAIAFGRPRSKREHRLYFVERIFDYSPIIAGYLKVNQEIVCDNERCGIRHSHEALSAIRAYDMLCPKCKQGHCRVINLSRKYERLIHDVAGENLLPQAELGILKTLHDERRKMFAKEIASELDCSYQLIGWRGKNLSERGLVDRNKNEQGRRIFEIEDKAQVIYFDAIPADSMDFGVAESGAVEGEVPDY
jgi:DNA-binding MarR family transcriptional regulator